MRIFFLNGVEVGKMASQSHFETFRNIHGQKWQFSPKSRFISQTRWIQWKRSGDKPPPTERNWAFSKYYGPKVKIEDFRAKTNCIGFFAFFLIFLVFWGWKWLKNGQKVILWGQNWWERSSFGIYYGNWVVLGGCKRIFGIFGF